jgi:MATE family multidrug resistance protein
MMSYTVMQFIDGWMVTRLGTSAFAAQANGAMIVYMLMALFIGSLSVVNTFVSQHLGAGDPGKCGAYGWAGLWICAGAAVGLAALAPFCSVIFRQMNHEPALLEMEVAYATILLYGGIFTLGARTTAYFFYGAHRPNVVLVAAVVGNSVNVLLNYVLIFGNWGFPALGITGAAIGTVIGSMVEFLIPMSLFLSRSCHEQFSTRTTWRPRAREIRDILRLGWPAGLMQSNEMVCWGIFMTTVVGVFGTAHIAAGWIGLRYLQVSFMPVVGLSFAMTAVVGRQMGRRDPVAAAGRAWLGVRLGMAYMGICAIIFVVFRRPMVELFLSSSIEGGGDAEVVLRVGMQIMICAAVFQLFDAIGIVLIGALRGAGDTVVPGLLTAGLSWVVIVGGGFAMAKLAPDLGAVGPWIAASVYIVILGIVMATRFARGRWREIELVSGDLSIAGESVRGVAFPEDEGLIGPTPAPEPTGSP